MVGNLSTIRKSKRLTQAELAAASGINRVTIAKYETGRQEPTVENAYRLATALGVTVDALIGNLPILPKSANHPPAQDGPQDATM